MQDTNYKLMYELTDEEFSALCKKRDASKLDISGLNIPYPELDDKMNSIVYRKSHIAESLLTIKMEIFKSSDHELFLKNYLWYIYHLNNIVFCEYSMIEFENELTNSSELNHYSDSHAKFLLDTFDVAFKNIYQLPKRTDYIYPKFSAYYRLFNKICKIIENKKLTTLKMVIDSKYEFFNFWSCLLNFPIIEQDRKIVFSEGYYFNLNYNLIAKFLKILPPEHINNYFKGLKLYLINSSNITDIFVDKSKIDILYDIFKEKEHSEIYYSENELFLSIYQSLRHLGFQSKLETFKDELKKSKVNLIFDNKGFYQDNVNKQNIPNYKIALFFKFLDSIEINKNKPIFSFKDFKFQLFDKSYNYNELMRIIKQNKSASTFNSNQIIKNLKKSVPNIDDLIEKAKYINGFKRSIAFYDSNMGSKTQSPLEDLSRILDSED